MSSHLAVTSWPYIISWHVLVLTVLILLCCWGPWGSRGRSNSLYWKRQKPDSGISSQRSDIWKQWEFIFIPQVKKKKKILWRWVTETRRTFRKTAVSPGRIHARYYVTVKLPIQNITVWDQINIFTPSADSQTWPSRSLGANTSHGKNGVEAELKHESRLWRCSYFF